MRKIKTIRPSKSRDPVLVKAVNDLIRATNEKTEEIRELKTKLRQFGNFKRHTQKS